MRIALLNLPYDNNYGGNLQRYALMKALQEMGHDVTYLYLKFDKHNPGILGKIIFTLKYIVRILLRKKTYNWKTVIFPRQTYEAKCRLTSPFVEKYISKTKEIYQVEDLKNFTDFDVFIVGSDQVWRKEIVKEYLDTMFFDYLPSDRYKIAYSVSLGSDKNELSNDDIDRLGVLYRQFRAVSVRESSALELFNYYGWTTPEAVHTLDPTLLLSAEDYKSLIEKAETKDWDGDMCCYILDRAHEKQSMIDKISQEKGFKPYYLSLSRNNSIEQWLKAFADAKYVVTDSYHGLVFSIIFNKPFYLIKNAHRGNARFDSLIELLEIETTQPEQNWSKINLAIQCLAEKSKRFLCEALNKSEVI